MTVGNASLHTRGYEIVGDPLQHLLGVKAGPVPEFVTVVQSFVGRLAEIVVVFAEVGRLAKCRRRYEPADGNGYLMICWFVEGEGAEPEGSELNRLWGALRLIPFVSTPRCSGNTSLWATDPLGWRS